MFTTARPTARAPRPRPRGRPRPPPPWGRPPAPPWTHPSGGWRPSVRAGRAAASWSAPRLCCPAMTRMMRSVLTPASAGGWRSASSAGPPHSEQSSPVQSIPALFIVYIMIDCVGPTWRSRAQCPGRGCWWCPARCPGTWWASPTTAATTWPTTPPRTSVEVRGLRVICPGTNKSHCPQVPHVRRR